MDGRAHRLPEVAGQLPPWQCCRSGTGPWQHYLHVGDGAYEHRGLCDDADHGEHGHPGERDDGCCCGTPGCDGAGPYPETP